jgi:hypothetical protein
VTDVSAVEAAIAEEGGFLQDVTREVEGVLVGQKALLHGLLVGLLADGHVLLEGVPGLAKSLAVQSLAQALGGTFRRIQFTPDLLPSDLIGTQVYHPGTGDWSVREGPVFANFVLADEINRAPAKVQSACSRRCRSGRSASATETHQLPGPSSSWRRRTRRAGGHLPAARGPGRPLHARDPAGGFARADPRGAARVDVYYEMVPLRGRDRLCYA